MSAPEQDNPARMPARRDGSRRAGVLGRRMVGEVVAHAMDELEVRREFGVTGWATGIASLDDRVRQVMAPGRVVCIAGGTKSGKTALAGQTVVALAAQGVPVLLGSFEDDQPDTMLRYLANLTSGDVGTIRDGFVQPDGTKLPIPDSFDTARQTLSALNIQLIAGQGTVEDIAYEAGDWWTEQQATGHAAGALVIDQLSHVIPSSRERFAASFPGFPPPPHVDDTTRMLEWQVEMLRRIAARWNLLVIVLHQLNTRQEEWEIPTERSIRGSQGIAHKVDALLIPWRPSKVQNPGAGLGEPKWVPNVANRAWITCPIGRQVERFTIEVAWHGAHQRYADLAQPVGAPWTPPPALTEHQAKGMRALADLRTRWATRSAGSTPTVGERTASDPGPGVLRGA
jgi:hypothetical protein